MTRKQQVNHISLQDAIAILSTKIGVKLNFDFAENDIKSLARNYCRTNKVTPKEALK